MIAPLVPQEVSLRGLPWMRLDTSRLLDSDLFALSTGDEFKAAVALWCKSWAQEPAGSLPNDDRVLAHLSGASVRWKKVKPMALRGWCLADDGRLYHPVVAEQALKAWSERTEFLEKVDAQNTRQQKLRAERAELMADLKANGIHLAWNAPISEVRDQHANLSRQSRRSDDQSRTCHGDSHGLDGTGRDGTLKASLGNTTRAHSFPKGAAEHARALGEVGYSGSSPHDPDLVAAAAEGITPEELAAAAAGKPGKPLAWVVQRARGRRADAAARAAGGATAGPPANGSPPPDPQALAERERRLGIEAKIHDAVHACDTLGLITAAERDRRVGELRQMLAAGQQDAGRVLA